MSDERVEKEVESSIVLSDGSIRKVKVGCKRTGDCNVFNVQHGGRREDLPRHAACLVLGPDESRTSFNDASTFTCREV